MIYHPQFYLNLFTHFPLLRNVDNDMASKQKKQIILCKPSLLDQIIKQGAGTICGLNLQAGFLNTILYSENFDLTCLGIVK